MPFTRPLHLFTGKGGVGKSTLSAALALEAAARGHRPLLVELGHRASLRSIFKVDTIGYEPVLVAPGVHATNVDLDHALADYLTRRVRVRSVAQRVAQSASLKRFFEAAPAVAEVLTLDRLEALMERFSPLLVDLDATGHALMFLELPAVFASLAPSGPFRQLLDGFAALLADKARTRLHLVTLPGRLPVQETLELYARLSGQGRVPLGALFVNRMPQPPLPIELIERAQSMLRAADHPGARADLELLLGSARAYEQAAAELQRLRSHPTGALPHVALPELDEPFELASLARLGRLAAEALA